MIKTNSIASEYVLNEVREYFSERADAEYFTDSADPVPNEEMKRLVEVFEAIDLIAKLKEENEALRKAQEWQPIETADKLERILILANQTVYTATWSDGVVRGANKFNGQKGSWHDVMSGVAFPDATHWMPVPNPKNTNQTNLKNRKNLLVQI